MITMSVWDEVGDMIGRNIPVIRFDMNADGRPVVKRASILMNMCNANVCELIQNLVNPGRIEIHLQVAEIVEVFRSAYAVSVDKRVDLQNESRLPQIVLQVLYTEHYMIVNNIMIPIPLSSAVGKDSRKRMESGVLWHRDGF